jgi:tRNA (pseudouridine54-N1)-methyltransferase
MRRFVVVGIATASAEFLLDDIPGTSGRLDVGLRCIRASLLVSHGLRRDAMVYLVLRGGPNAPRILRIDGAAARFLRPDERSLAVLVKKVLASDADRTAAGFVEVKAGVAIARGDLERVVPDLADARRYVLEMGAPDLRDTPGLEEGNAAFFLGDSLGVDAPTRAQLTLLRCRAIGVGPIVVHAEDAIAIVSNELDRREAARLTRSELPALPPQE